MNSDRLRMHRPTAEVTTPVWMVTYADMVTLLLCLFAGLLSMSSIKPELFRSVLGSVHGALGLPGGGAAASSEDDSLSATLRREIKELQSSADASSATEVIQWADMTQTSHGVLIRLSGSNVFANMDSDIQADAKELALQLARVVGTRGVRIKVTGHTAKEMKAGGDERVLSFRRAAEVAEVLEEGGVPAGSISVEAVVDAEPLWPHAYTEERKAFNRGVTIAIEESGIKAAVLLNHRDPDTKG